MLKGARWLLDFYIRLGAHLPRKLFYMFAMGSVIMVYIVYAYTAGETETDRSLLNDMAHLIFALVPVAWIVTAYGYWFKPDVDPLGPEYFTIQPAGWIIIVAFVSLLVAANFLGWS